MRGDSAADLLKGFPLLSPTNLAAPTGGPEWLVDLRGRAAVEAASLEAPSATEELWRYSPINDLNLQDFATVGAPSSPTLAQATLERLIGERAATVVLVDGYCTSIAAPGLPDGVTITSDSEIVPSDIPSYRSRLDALHDALTPALITVDVPSGVSVSDPIVILHELVQDQALTAPWLVVRLGAGASARVVEIAVGGGKTLTLSSSQFEVGSGAHLRHVAVQLASPLAWHLARQVATVDRDATFESFSVGLGGAYDRVHTEVTITGSGGSSKLRSLYLGAEHQVHDIRTVQDHAAPHTTSDLLCKGAVAESATSVYTGTIKIRNGAIRSDAVQNNHNLVLGEHAQAESVPNLDIQENDVRCAHGSTVGPVDEEQRYYLESRGIEPEVAERLLVTGFFDDALDQLPIAEVAPLVREVLSARLSSTLGVDHG